MKFDMKEIYDIIGDDSKNDAIKDYISYIERTAVQYHITKVQATDLFVSKMYARSLDLTYRDMYKITRYLEDVE